jgi:hypothetical protein
VFSFFTINLPPYRLASAMKEIKASSLTQEVREDLLEEEYHCYLSLLFTVLVMV